MRHNTLYYGDNLSWMKQWPAECVDLIYLDPPFNSHETYNLLYTSEVKTNSSAQIKAFTDTWRWGPQAVTNRDEALRYGDSLATTIQGLGTILGNSGMYAYLCHLAPRLAEMNRLLKHSASIYLHCDDTASHYIKILMDAVFGPTNYRNTIIWRRTVAHNDATRFGRITDHILFYAKGPKPFWNGQAIAIPQSAEELKRAYPLKDGRGAYRAADLTGAHRSTGASGKPWKGYDIDALGRHWSVPLTGDYTAYIDQHFIPDYCQISDIHERLDALDQADLIHHPISGKWPGLKRYAAAATNKSPQNLIFNPTGFTNYNKGKEYLGYPTQKPEKLLRILIDAACPVDGIVLDPYCGCGTTLHVAQATGRPWVGIDITHLAIAVIEHRFRERLNIEPTVIGKPEDMQAARDLFKRDPFQFEAWAISLIPGLMPNERKRGDRGIDGRGYTAQGNERRLIIAQVKGGKNVTPAAVRDLRGTLQREKAALGVLIVMDNHVLTPGIHAELACTRVDIDGSSYPDLQSFTIADYFAGRRPDLPLMLIPFANRNPDLVDQANRIPSILAK